MNSDIPEYKMSRKALYTWFMSVHEEKMAFQLIVEKKMLRPSKLPLRKSLE
jgi:hypothetical protein